MCSHGSDLDTRIPRPAASKRALPDCIRRKIKGRKEEPSVDDIGPARLQDPETFYQAGAGVLKPRGVEDGGYRAGCQRNFLKRGTGKPMSERASRLAQMRNGDGVSRGVYNTESTSATYNHQAKWKPGNQKPRQRSKMAGAGAMMMSTSASNSLPNFTC